MAVKGALALTFSEVEARARDAALAALPDAGPAAAARAAITTADNFLAQASAVGLASSLAQLACAAACTSCCHQMVGVTVAELALIKGAVDRLSEPVRQGIAQRAAALADTAKGDPRSWWKAKLPCPLLDDGQACLVYAARPLPCRAMNSADAGACRRSLAGEAVRIPVLAAQHGIMGHAQAGLAQALAKAGLEHRPIVLGTALARF